MATAATKPMTAEEFFLTEEPEDGKYELVNGEVVFIPPPGLRHGEVQGLVHLVVKLYPMANRIGRVFTESGALVEHDRTRYAGRTSATTAKSGCRSAPRFWPTTIRHRTSWPKWWHRPTRRRN